MAILLTHWHNADGTVTWLDPGSELWGREFRDRNGYSLRSLYMNLLALSGLLNFKLPSDDRSLNLGYPVLKVKSPHRPAAIDLLPYPIDASWAVFMPVGFENQRRSAGTESIVPGRGGAGG